VVKTKTKLPETSRLRFECTGCGLCCTQRGGYAHVYVNAAEVAGLAALLGVTAAKLRRRHTFVDELGWRQLRFRDGACTFLDPATQRCTVYAARPVQCRTFPYWPELIGPRGWRREAKAMCEGMGRGPVIEREEVVAAMREMRERDRCED
jgi:Fe-S-cluster containining protein